MKTLVIIPAYNEEESILRVVRNLENADIDCDYIVINDCSKDSTGKILQTGYKYAYYNNYDAAIQFDGDGQHLPEYIPSLVKEIENGYDIVIGSRFVDEKKHFSMRMLGSRIITAMIKLTTGVTINDPTSGMRIINKELIKDYAFELNRKPEPDTLAFQIKKGYKAKEVQVQYMLKVLITIIFFN